MRSLLLLPVRLAHALALLAACALLALPASAAVNVPPFSGQAAGLPQYDVRVNGAHGRVEIVDAGSFTIDVVDMRFPFCSEGHSGDCTSNIEWFRFARTYTNTVGGQPLWSVTLAVEDDTCRSNQDASCTVTVTSQTFGTCPGFFQFDAGFVPVIFNEISDQDELPRQPRIASVPITVDFSGQDCPPVADFDYDVIEGTKTVVFDAGFSHDADDRPIGSPPSLSYRWDFDGETVITESDPDITYTFQEAGAGKHVTLTVFDNEGDQDTRDDFIDVEGQPGDAFFTHQPSILDPLEILFDASFSIPSEGADEVFFYDWDFGDGDFDSTDAVTSHVYADPGEYTVYLFTEDDQGFTAEYEEIIEVGGPARPTPDFTAVQQPYPPFQVELVGSDTLSDLTAIQGWEWVFGDGAPDGFGKIQLHGYPGPGTYRVELTARDAQDDAFEAVQNVDVGFWGVFQDAGQTLLVPPPDPEDLLLGFGALPPGLFDQLVTYGWPVIFPGGIGRTTGLDFDVRLGGSPVQRVGDPVGECVGAGCGACTASDAGTIDFAPNDVIVEGDVAARKGGFATLTGACGPGIAILATCRAGVASPTLAELEAAGCVPYGVASVLASASSAGDTQVDADASGLSLGDEVLIAPGTDRQEQAVVVGFGSVVFDRPLAFDHLPGDKLAVFDADGDGVADGGDNCRNVPNPDQADADAGSDDDTTKPGMQSYGDACDRDLDDDGLVGASDFFAVFRPCLGADLVARPECRQADLDGDGVVAASDFFSELRPAFGSTPGPGRSLP